VSASTPDADAALHRGTVRPRQATAQTLWRDLCVLGCQNNHMSTKQQHSESEQHGERQAAARARAARWISLVALYASSAALGFAAASFRTNESGYVILLIAILNLAAYFVARIFDSREFLGILEDNRDQRHFLLRYTRLQLDRIGLEIQVGQVAPSDRPSDALDQPLEEEKSWAERLADLGRLEDTQARLALTQTAVEQVQENRLREAYDEYLAEILDSDSRGWLEAGQHGAVRLWRDD
jgi:hypothetical protein